MNIFRALVPGFFAFLLAGHLGAQTYNVTSAPYSADPSGVIEATAAIQQAVNDCHVAGAGTVLIPSGTYKTGEVQLKSNVTLEIAEGAVVVAYTGTKSIGQAFNTHETLYPETGGHHHKHPGGTRSIFFAEGTASSPVVNVTVKGKGTIDALGHHPYFQGATTTCPRTLRFLFCNNVVVQDVTLQNTVSWIQGYERCDGVTIQSIKVFNIDSEQPGDGLDVLNCSNVTIKYCYIDADDDAIAIKSSGEPIWPDVPVTPMSNITIENNSLYSARNNAITYGTDTYGPLSNYTIRNNFIRFAAKGAICVNAADGADVSDVLIQNNYAADCGVPLFLRLNNRDRSETGVGSMQDVLVEKLQAQYCRNEFGSSITGIPGANIEGVILKDVYILMRAGMTTVPLEPDEYETEVPKTNVFGDLPSYALYLRHISDVTLENVNVGTRVNDVRDWLVHSDDGNDGPLTIINCTDYRGTPLPIFTLVRKDLQVNDCVYSDTNTDKFTSTIPAALLGSDWIRAKKASASYLLDFLIGYESNVYLAVDSSESAPAWIASAGFTPLTGGTLTLNTGQSFTVYEKRFAAGSLVSLGDSSVASKVRYFAMVKPVTPPVPLSAELTPDWPAVVGGVNLTSATIMSGTSATVEAENAHARTVGTNGKAWEIVTIGDPGVAIGGSVINNAIQALPNGGGTLPTAPGPQTPRADYPVEIPVAGNYYVHFRARGDTQADSDNSIYLTVNGNVSSYQNVTTPPISLTWVKAATPLALSAGLNTINVWMREDGQVMDRLSVTTSSTVPTGLGPVESPRSNPQVAWQMSGNQVVMEAENAYFRAGGNGKSWLTSNVADASGGTIRNAIKALPETGSAGTSTPANSAKYANPRADYPINVPTAGNFYVWIYGRGATSSDNTFFVSLNGSTTTFQQVDALVGTNGMGWVRTANPIALTAGINTITLWMKEDGLIIDRVLVKDNTNTPAGAGPSESTRN